MTMLRVSGLFIYPVKSLRGVAVAEAEVDRYGLAGDRRFMVVDEAGLFMTQRGHPRMATVGAALAGGALVLSAEGMTPLRVPRGGDGRAEIRRVTVWKSADLAAEDCGEEAAAWLGEALRARCRLVRIGEGYRRPVGPARAEPGDSVSFADGYPLLVATEASLEDLNRRIEAEGGAAVPMDRFRPGLVVRGARPYEEDGWRRIRAGGLVLRGAGPCGRCVVTATDQATGARGKEPLRTLAGYRRDGRGEVNFGQNLIHETKSGRIAVGDAVEVAERHPDPAEGGG